MKTQLLKQWPRFSYDVKSAKLRPPLHYQVRSGVLAILMASSAWLPQGAAAQRPAGTVVSWGSQMTPQVPPGTRFRAIAAGYDHSLALTQDGTVVAWGENSYGQSMVPPGLSGLVAVATGWTHNLALTQDGTVTAWGGGEYGQLIFGG